jgi:hypothetical protein
MFCSQCGHPVLDGAAKCSRCGAGLRPGEAGAEYRLAKPGAARFFRRVMNIVRSPLFEWPVIAAETSSRRALYFGYVAPLAAIGVVANFIGQSVVGLPFLGRVSFSAAFVHGLFTYALSFVGVFALARVIDLLAPTFGGRRDPLAALKVTAYCLTPGWLAGVFNIVPILSVIGIAGALYGVYLLYVGLPVVMRCPSKRSPAYTVIVVLFAIVVWALMALLASWALELLGFGVVRSGRA